MKKFSSFSLFFLFMLIFSLFSCTSIPESEKAVSFSEEVIPDYVSKDSEFLEKAEFPDENISFQEFSEYQGHHIELVDLYENTAEASWEIYCPVFNSPELQVLQNECMAYTKSKAQSFKSEIRIVSSERDEDYIEHFSYSQNCTVSFYKDFINVLFESWCYSGGAHGNVYYKTITFNSKTGTFCNILEVSEMSEEELSEFCCDYLISRLEPEETLGEYYYSMYYSWIQTGTVPSKMPFLNYTFYQDNEERGIEVVFEPYSVAPYSRGNQVVQIPLEK